MSSIKILIGTLSAVGLLCGTAAVALANGTGYAANPYYETDAAPVTTGGRQIYHPAWSFACAERDVSERILPCDQPIWVYGNPCEVGIGVQGVTLPCRH